MFYKGNFYRHKNTLDTDILVMDVLDENETHIRLLVHFVDRNHNFIFEMNSDITLDKKDSESWRNVK